VELRRGSVLAAALSVLLVAGCSSVHRDMAFPDKGGKAFVLLAADGMSSGGYSFLFRRIDVERGKPLDDGFAVFFDGMALGGDEFAKPEGVTALTRFGGRAVPAGDYALMGRIDL